MGLNINYTIRYRKEPPADEVEALVFRFLEDRCPEFTQYVPGFAGFQSWCAVLGESPCSEERYTALARRVTLYHRLYTAALFLIDREMPTPLAPAGYPAYRAWCAEWAHCAAPIETYLRAAWALAMPAIIATVECPECRGSGRMGLSDAPRPSPGRQVTETVMEYRRRQVPEPGNPGGFIEVVEQFPVTRTRTVPDWGGSDSAPEPNRCWRCQGARRVTAGSRRGIDFRVVEPEALVWKGPNAEPLHDFSPVHPASPYALVWDGEPNIERAGASSIDWQILCDIRQCGKARAIQNYREAADVDLAEAREYVDAVEAGRSPEAPRIESADLEFAVRWLLAMDSATAAVTLVMRHAGASLAAAQEYVEELAGPPPPRDDRLGRDAPADPGDEPPDDLGDSEGLPVM